MSLGARIKTVRGTLSQGEFAEALRVSKSAIGGYERDVQSPGSTVIMAICNRFGVDPRWLLFGTGAMRGEESSPSPEGGNNLVRIPVAEARLREGALVPSPGRDSGCGFGRSFLESRGDPARMILICANGISMEPEIRQGDMVLIDQGQTVPLPGTLFAVSFEDLIYIRMVDAVPGRLVLRSCNAAYPDIELNAHMQDPDVRFIGKAVWLCREIQ